jgi:metal-responsive CopG/Arc/MetJ family transcriptional regulator
MPAKRVLISIQEQLLVRVDERAARLGIGRSTYLAQLAAADLEGQSGPGGEANARGGIREADRLFTSEADD